MATRPITTWDRGRTRFDPFVDSPPVVLDQLLVSGRALRGGPISLREASVAYPCAGDSAGTDLFDNYRPDCATLEAVEEEILGFLGHPEVKQRLLSLKDVAA